MYSLSMMRKARRNEKRYTSRKKKNLILLLREKNKGFHAARYISLRLPLKTGETHLLIGNIESKVQR